jgi:hypothetical protein
MRYAHQLRADHHTSHSLHRRTDLSKGEKRSADLSTMRIRSAVKRLADPVNTSKSGRELLRHLRAHDRRRQLHNIDEHTRDDGEQQVSG